MSSKPKPKTKIDGLLAAVQRKAPTATEPTPEPVPATGSEAVASSGPRPKPTVRATAGPKSRVGKPVQFWLHDEDRRLVRELSAWLAGQGERPTDSMVIRSALRMAHTNAELLKAYRQASQLDGRLKQHKKTA
jgi:hypothetical protein